MELTPVLNAGFLPPIAEGFAEFCRAPDVAGKIDEIRRAAEERGSADVFDTHPSLSERLTALGDANPDAPGNGGPAIALLENIPETTLKLLEHMWGAEAVAKLRPIEWKAVGDAVYIARWKAVAGQFDQWLCQFTADSVPVDKSELIRLGSNLVKRTEININAEERIGRALYVLGVGLASVLVACGFGAETAPGRRVELIRGAERIDPFAILHQLLDGTLSLDEWKSTCDRIGIRGVRLGQSEAAAS